VTELSSPPITLAVLAHCDICYEIWDVTYITHVTNTMVIRCVIGDLLVAYLNKSGGRGA
jgi:hypothetical protein